MSILKKEGMLQGIIICLLLALPSVFLGKLLPIVGGPVFAILIGMIIRIFYKGKGKNQVGITFTSKKILQLAVILLGFGLNLHQIAKVGLESLPIILSTITTSLVVAFIVCKIMKIPSDISTLIGVGSSICGGSAIAAASSVMNVKDKDIAQAISVIFFFNVIAALVFPTLGDFIGLSNHGFAIFAGSAVNDTSSVTATAAAWDGIHKGANALDGATIVKLTRTLAIIPITIALAFITAYKEKKKNLIEETEEEMKGVKLSKILPTFIIYFLIASIITTISVYYGVDVKVFAPIKTLSKFFIVMAMGAIGLNTDIVELVKSGGKAIFLGLCCWVSISIVCLSMQYFVGLW